MNKLELKIPPVILLLLFMLVMFGLSRVMPLWQITSLETQMSRYLIVFIALVGGVIALAGVFHFHQAKTTVHPSKVEQSTNLVTNGVYRLTRNPMYVGMLFVLSAWAMYQATLMAICLIPGFVLYMNRFQIKPEERALLSKFGQVYAAYTEQVPRWLK